jgi:hypothetical protein
MAIAAFTPLPGPSGPHPTLELDGREDEDPASSSGEEDDDDL